MCFLDLEVAGKADAVTIVASTGAQVWQSKQTYDNIKGQSGKIVLNHNVIASSEFPLKCYSS